MSSLSQTIFSALVASVSRTDSDGIQGADGKLRVLMGQTRGRLLKISEPYTFTRYIASNTTIVAGPENNYSLQHWVVFFVRRDASTTPQSNVRFNKLKTITQSQASRPDETEVLLPRTLYGRIVHVVYLI